jgi:hypothetical protein
MARTLALQKNGVDPVGAPDFTLPVSILAQVIESLKVDIAAQSITLLNIKLESVGDVTLNVNITGTPTVNIQTSGGANIVIDKLTQGAYTERRDVLANNGATATMVASNLTNKRGKFFPRGCRGFLRYVEVYCDNADSVAHTFTVKIAPMPGMGSVYTGTVSVAAGSSAAWRMVQFNKYWNYDSMFIWVICDSDSYGRLGYDTGEPHDCYMSTDEVSWLFYDYRFWFRIALSGMTVGDLPVSGTVNIIEIPSSMSARQGSAITVPAGGEAYDTEILGCGEVLIVIFWAPSNSARDYLRPRIKCDGVQVLPFDFTVGKWHDVLVGQSSQGICIGVWDTTNWNYTLIVALPITFKRSLQVGWYNEGTSSYTGTVAYIFKRIS